MTIHGFKTVIIFFGSSLYNHINSISCFFGGEGVGGGGGDFVLLLLFNDCTLERV